MGYGDIEIKINELSMFRNTTDCINLIKLCESLNELSDLKSCMFSKSEELEELGELESDQLDTGSNVVGSGDPGSQLTIESQSSSDLSKSRNGPKPLSNYLVLLLRFDSIRNAANTATISSNDLIRSELRKNLFLSNIWHIVILYVIFFCCCCC